MPRLSTALNDVARATTLEELEAVWKKYETANFKNSNEAADFSVAYHKREASLSLGSEYRDTVQTVEPGLDRRTIWETRVKEFREEMRKELELIAQAKAEVKRHRDYYNALESDLMELIDAGVDDFIIDATPLLTIAEAEQDAEEKES